MEVKRLRNHLNPEYIQENFYKTTNLAHRSLDIKANESNTTKYDNKSLRTLVPHIWNSLPKQIKEETDYNKFKKYIDKWFGAQRKCNLFSYLS